MGGFALIFAIVVVVLISLFWLRPARAKCPACNGRKASMIQQEVQEVRPYDLISGEGGGKMLMLEIKETFRCSQCGHVWARTRTEA